MEKKIQSGFCSTLVPVEMKDNRTHYVTERVASLVNQRQEMKRISDFWL